MKDNDADFSATPSNLGNQVFWESPDLFLVPHGTPVDLTSVSTETTITPGGQFDIYVRVHGNDLGCANVNNVTTMVYLADPAALSIQWNAITNNKYVGPNGGTTGVTAPAGGAALIGPIPFTAPTSGIGDGHWCIIAAIQGTGEAAPAKPFDAPDSNQVAQRNVQFASPCIFPLTNGTASTGNVDITLSVTPNTGTKPSLTSGPDVQVSFDDTDSSWFNVWNSQPGNGSTFQVTHSASTNQTVVHLPSFSGAHRSPARGRSDAQRGPASRPATPAPPPGSRWNGVLPPGYRRRPRKWVPDRVAPTVGAPGRGGSKKRVFADGRS